MIAKESLFIGAHMSISGGVHQALLRGQEIGATTIQIFTANQKRWASRPISEKEIFLWEKTLNETQIKKVMSHDSYLINLGSPKKDVEEKSLKAFEAEIQRCLQLNLNFLNFHPGAATGDTEESCLNRISANLIKMVPLFEKNHSLKLLIETTAGQGTTIGYRFEHLAYIIGKVHGILPIGVCLDTCHIFAAGYDICTLDGWNATLDAFEKIVGLKHLCALHVNDSKQALGSRKDRHASLGKGEIGLESFRFMMEHPKLKTIPKYLETPDGETMWKDEIALLQKFAKQTCD